VAGGTGNSTLYLVDGGYNNDPLNNIGQPMPFPDALQEFKLENGVRPARYGVYTGATVNAVTKSGSNAFHGSGFAFGAPPLVQCARPLRHCRRRPGARANRRHSRRSDHQEQVVLLRRPADHERTDSPDVGGYVHPDAKDAGGGLHRRDVRRRARVVSTARSAGAFVGNKVNPALFNPIAVKIAALLPTGSTDACGRTRFTVPNDSDEIQTVLRSDYQLNASQKIFGRYYVANYDRQPSYDGTNLLLATGSGLGLDNRVQTLALGHDWVLTPNIVAATRFSYQRFARAPRAG
jgi:hypothetical protein